MWELLCPQHGIPAFLAWVVLGGDLEILYLTIRMSFSTLSSMFKFGGR